MYDFILTYNAKKINLDELFNIHKILSNQNYKIITIPDSCSLKEFNIETLKELNKKIEKIIEEEEIING